MMVLATFATIIASQALISGVFSLTRQAMQMGLAPRARITSTSFDEAGLADTSRGDGGHGSSGGHASL